MPYAAFRRQPVPQPYAQTLRPVTIPAPTRGIIENEDEAFMQPGGAVVLDNWAPTLKGVKLRGGCERWCVLPDTTPVISAFEYVIGSNQRMYAAQATTLYDVTAATPTVVVSGQASGNWCAAQLSNMGGDWLIAVNEAGDIPLRFNGTTWNPLGPTDVPADGAGTITGPGGVAIRLSYVWKYRGRLYFIESGTMNAYYLGIDSVGGELAIIPLSGAATKGGYLLAGASWSLDAGDGIDDKCVFITSLGELLIFTGSNPADPANWRQEGRYAIGAPLGMNAHISVGGDLLILTVDGIVPVSQAINKDSAQLDLSLLTRTIRRTWRREVNVKRAWAWTVKKWDEYGGMFVTTPGGAPGNRYCLACNSDTIAWCRFVGWDATCFIRLRGDMFFGTQDGVIMQADRTGYDDGVPYVATLVGGWEMFGAPSNTNVWRQSRAVFRSSAGQPFQPQLSATTDFVVTIPPPPVAGPDPGIQDVWDQGLWGPDGAAIPPTSGDITRYAQWDQPSVAAPPVRNTMWVSIGMTGFAHAPIVQVTVAQAAKPDVELLALTATSEPAGVNV